MFWSIVIFVFAILMWTCFAISTFCFTTCYVFLALALFGNTLQSIYLVMMAVNQKEEK